MPIVFQVTLIFIFPDTVLKMAPLIGRKYSRVSWKGKNQQKDIITEKGNNEAIEWQKGITPTN